MGSLVVPHYEPQRSPSPHRRVVSKCKCKCKGSEGRSLVTTAQAFNAEPASLKQFTADLSNASLDGQQVDVAHIETMASIAKACIPISCLRLAHILLLTGICVGAALQSSPCSHVSQQYPHMYGWTYGCSPAILLILSVRL